MSRVLILDDDPIRHTTFAQILKGHDVTHVKTANAACLALRKKFHLVCLDHDLGDFLIDADKDCDPGNGLEVAEFLAFHADSKNWPTNCIIHSHNPEGAKRMVEVLRENTTINVSVIPFSV